MRDHYRADVVSVPKEVIQERPSVFSNKESFDLVRGFATKFHRLVKESLPTSKPESLGHLVLNIENVVKDVVGNLLSEFLAQKNYDERRIARIQKAVCMRDFSSVEIEGDTDELITTLGLALIAERVRSQVFTETLRHLNPEELASLGLREKLRDLIVPLFSGLSSIDTEFVRFKARALRSEPYPDSAVDAVGEQQGIASVLRQFYDGVEEKGAEVLFGDSGEDFLVFLKLLIDSYQTVSPSGIVFSDLEMKERAKNVKQSFAQFIKAHPDHCLMFVPKMFSYVETGEDVDLGFDPEIRILWQSSEHKKETAGFMQDSVAFYQSIREQFSDLMTGTNVTHIDSYRPIVCDDIGSWGINMVFRAEGFEEGGTSFLIENRIHTALTEPIKEIIDFIQRDRKIVSIPIEKFEHAVKRLLLSHELSHRFFDAEYLKERLGDVYRSIEEQKADLLAACGFAAMDQKETESVEDKQEHIFLNLIILGNALLCSSLSSTGELAAYYHSAIGILNCAAERDIFVEWANGTVTLDFQKMNGDFAKIVGERARKVLTIYQGLTDNTQSPSDAQKIAILHITEEPVPIIKKWIHQFGQKSSS